MTSTEDDRTPGEERIAEIAAEVRASGAEQPDESVRAAAGRAGEIREQAEELVQRGQTAALDPTRRPWVPKALLGTVAGLVTWRIFRRHS
ncbi:hypothetical protein [Nocardia harenae]|uniref:hypothetical protein n=1 Tax=Nocardia harenae TaxID=358707 RepID=UPI000835AA70|nr:hypothetical protein [Nocardia harenae]